MVTRAPTKYAWRLAAAGEAARHWDDWLSAFADRSPRQCFAWGQYKKGSWEPLHTVLFREGRPVAMALAQTRRAPLSAATIVWINAGPVFDASDPEAARAYLSGLKAHLAGQRNPVLRVSPHVPLENGLAAILEEEGFVPARAPLNSGKTMVLDLAMSLETLRENLDRKWRNQLKAAEKRSPVFTIGRDETLLRRYHRLHEAMCRRKGLSAQRVSLAALLEMASALGDRIVFLVGAAEGRDGCGGAVLTFAGKAMLWHSAADDWGLKNSLPNAFYWEAISHLKAAGVQTFDLGGVDPENSPGVSHFKAGLGAPAVSWTGEWDWSPSPLARGGFNWALKALRGRLP